MKEKLETLAEQPLVSVCCVKNCQAIKIDENNWIYEHDAQEQGLHAQFHQVLFDKRHNLSHGYCPVHLESYFREMNT